MARTKDGRGRQYGRRRQRANAEWGAALEGHDGRHRRGAGMLNQGDLRLLVLGLIADNPRHGYEIIRVIENTSMGVYRPSAGAVYPTLSSLEDLGHISASTSSQVRKTYEITTAGKDFLENNAHAMSAVNARLSGIRKLSDDRQTQQIRRAMDNLKAGLRLRLSSAPLTQEQLHRMVDAIDAAAVAVERA